MTALDQALIRAFQQQGASPVALPPQPAPPASNNSPPTLSLSDIFSGVLAALEKAPSRPAVAEPAESSPRPMVAASQGGTGGAPAAEAVAEPDRFLRAIGGLPSIEIGGPQWPLESQQWVIGSEHWAPSGGQWGTGHVEERVEDNDLCHMMNVRLPAEPAAADACVSPGVVSNPEPSNCWVARAACLPMPSAVADKPPVTPIAVAPNVVTPSATSHVCRTTSSAPAVLEPRVANPEPQIANPESFAPCRLPPAPPPPDFKPAWQVDRFTWPKVCRRLMAKAPEEWDRLCDALLAAGARGQKVLAIAGCGRGEGATTLLLCAASRLAERGIKTVLVDADSDRPRLAKRLGVQPQLGWNEITDDDGGLGRATVEAAGGLAVLPLRESPPSGRKTLDWSRLADALDTLRDHYQMVLVDLGPLEDADRAAGSIDARGIDALLLVCNRRLTSDQQLSETQRRLAAAGIPLAGLIENFVAE